jgi:ribosomal protein L11 methyltransferase
MGVLVIEWIEAKIETKSEAIENVCAMLISVGINGVQIEDVEEMKLFLDTNKNQWDYVDDELINSQNENCYVVFYVSDNTHGKEQIVSVKGGINRLKNLKSNLNFGSLTLELLNVDDEEWLNSWKKYYKPFEVGEKIVIKPMWEQYENANKIVFNINPGHVFGTGLHNTTQLCIIRLEKYINKEVDVLDLGCGSGILSIISLLLGAKTAVAVDIDPNAVNIAYENARLNNIDDTNYTVMSGDILEDKQLKSSILTKQYDVVVANIVADVIILFSSFVPQCIKKDGMFICCGIIKDRLEEVYLALNENNFTIIDTFYDGEWVCVVSQF